MSFDLEDLVECPMCGGCGYVIDICLMCRGVGMIHPPDDDETASNRRGVE